MFGNEERDKRIKEHHEDLYKLRCRMMDKARRGEVISLESLVLNLIDYLDLELKEVPEQRVPEHWIIVPKTEPKEETPVP